MNAKHPQQSCQRGDTTAIKFSLLALLVCAEGFKSPEKLGDAMDSSAGNQRLASLQKQLDIENKVGLRVLCSSAPNSCEQADLHRCLMGHFCVFVCCCLRVSKLGLFQL